MFIIWYKPLTNTLKRRGIKISAFDKPLETSRFMLNLQSVSSGTVT